MDHKISILLVDDHSLFRESLSRLLASEPDFRVSATCASIEDALAILEHENVDLVLLDYDLGEKQGLGFIEQARRSGFAGRILMVTAGMTEEVTIRALERGCSGIFLKHSPPGQLIEAIHQVMAGGIWLDSEAIRSLISRANGKLAEQRNTVSLTTRERAVLKALFEGLTNKEIASQLNVSENVVKWAMQQLFEKTGARTRSQLVRVALEKQRDWRMDASE
jgi:DNA-binding NarL/FixJ family response regulator